MDKIQKALLKLVPRQREVMLKILKDVAQGNIIGYDLKKIKGRKDIYRIRKGKMRVIVLINREETKVLAIEQRSDTTYNEN